ncbi:M13 family metallopeptidase N-terminal domain-containing protein [Caulobacter segnis]|uniref:M13 family metallopeptidase N-terminal domain-containing protein n=1 Tax=Caulobacter segnis TaxID=88688 RepID=UPI0024101CA1|nr:M13 family metallopeptidase N-terminal domain-containing protein [Caulobacter segnis]MDG2523267.1 M13 family metallopeptidase N-terminal domain-containing protein [Caulobacter segnis]
MDRALFAAAALVLVSGTALAQPKPGDDFYAYANSDWLKATTLPAGRVSLDTTAMLRDQATVRIRTLVEMAANERVAGPGRRVGDYYAAFLDTAAIEAKGLTPIAGELAAGADRGGAGTPDRGRHPRSGALPRQHGPQPRGLGPSVRRDAGGSAERGAGGEVVVRG